MTRNWTKNLGLIMGNTNVQNVIMDRKSAKLKEILFSKKGIMLPSTRIIPDTISSIKLICTNGYTNDLETEVINAGISDPTA